MERMRRMLEERFLRYVAYDTMSDEHAQSAPSSVGQLCLANLLVQEMKEIGIADAFVISCHYDPNVMQLRRAVSKPVIGIGEAAIRLASILGIR